MSRCSPACSTRREDMGPPMNPHVKPWIMHMTSRVRSGMLSANTAHMANVTAIDAPATMQKGLRLPRLSDHLEIGSPTTYVITAAISMNHAIPRADFPRTVAAKKGTRYIAPVYARLTSIRHVNTDLKP